MTQERTRYIMVDPIKGNMLVTMAQGFCDRRNLSQSSSNIKKLSRMARARDRGYVIRPATLKEVQLYGPPLNVGGEDD